MAWWNRSEMFGKKLGTVCWRSLLFAYAFLGGHILSLALHGYSWMPFKNMLGYKHMQLKNFPFDFAKRYVDFKAMLIICSYQL